MKIASWKMLIADRLLVAIIGAILLTVLITVMTSVSSARYRGKNDSLRLQLEEIRAFSNRAVQLKSSVGSIEKKLKRKSAGGIVATLEGILKPLGLKAAVLKPLGKQSAGAYTEENADLEIEDSDLNSVVNLLYRIETSPSPLKVKSASIRSTFEDPDRFILRLTVSLISS
jgi:uncharacterized protein YlxW (UPF0749 family)